LIARERRAVYFKEKPSVDEVPLVSAIIPTHNQAALLQEALDSVYSEDFISFSAILVRREVLQRAGYFDESLPTMDHYGMSRALRLMSTMRSSRETSPFNVTRDEGRGPSPCYTETMSKRTPTLVKRALAMLPDTAEYAPVKRKARASLFFEIANSLTSVARRG
jgi:hypothetical protein